MKLYTRTSNASPSTSLLVRYRWILIASLASLLTHCHLCNSGTDSNTNSTPTTSNLQFEKLAFDLTHAQVVAIIKNSGNATAKSVALKCTNISQDTISREEVLLNGSVNPASLSIPDLAPNTTAQPIYIAINFQYATKATLQFEITSEQQLVQTRAIDINLYPLDLIPIGPTLVAGTNEGSFKYRLVTNPGQSSIDFNKFKLQVRKAYGVNAELKINHTTLLDQYTNSATLTGDNLANLAQQQEILVKVTNHSARQISIFSELLNNKDKPIATIAHQIVLTLLDGWIPAISVGDVAFVKQAIDSFVDKKKGVNQQGNQGSTGLHFAASYGHIAVVDMLIKNGADVNIQDETGCTPLHEAAENSHQEAIRLLLQAGADRTIQNKDGETAADIAETTAIKDFINNWKK